MSYRYLSYDDRKIIEQQYASGESAYTIADAIGVGVATVYNELKRGCTGELDANRRMGYSAQIGQSRLEWNIRQRGNRVNHEQTTGRSLGGSVTAEHQRESAE